MLSTGWMGLRRRPTVCPPTELAEKIMAMPEEARAGGEEPVPEVLRAFDLDTADCVDAVFPLLDNEQRS